MANTNAKLVGVGNAIVDILVNVDDETLRRHDLEKGGMHLVSEEANWALYQDVGPASEISGGSVANSIAHAAGGGTSCAFLGKVADDTFGKVFRHDLTSLGIGFPVQPGPAHDGNPGTGRSIVMITPDGQRTMCTFLGASISLNAGDVENALPDGSEVVLIEGYLWDAPCGPQAIDTIAAKAKAAGARIAVTLSDAGCVLRHQDQMRAFVESDVDILFANHKEAQALAQATDDEAALDFIRSNVSLAAITRSELGSWVVQGNTLTDIPPAAVDKVVDTTGAGDAYAGAFLRAYLAGDDMAACGRAGSQLAAQVIRHIGAREVERQKEAAAD